MKALKRERQIARAISKEAARGARDGLADTRSSESCYKPNRLLSITERLAYINAFRTAASKYGL